jgi:PPE-repeat protein
MDSAVFPPEINSARMYTGPGSGSLMAAAASWDSLAGDLDTTAQTYQSVLSDLTTLRWHGPAAAAMTAAVIPYMDWLSMTAEQTQQTAMQARAAAMAFEQAYAMTVPPLVIAANRAQLMALIATNLLGQNTAAIAAAEAQYAEMWAQDAGAMYGYASSSAAATALTPFSSPQQTTNPAGLSAQSGAASQASATADPVPRLPGFIQQLLADLSYLEDQLGTEYFLPYFNTIASAFGTPISPGTAFITVVQSAANSAAGQAPFDFSGMAPAIAEGIAPVVNALQPGSVGGAISAAVGKAGSIGPLSVPASWAAPSTGHVSALTPAGLTTFTGTEETAGSGAAGAPGMAMPAPARGSGVLPRYGIRLTVMTHPPAAG